MDKKCSFQNIVKKNINNINYYRISNIDKKGDIVNILLFQEIKRGMKKLYKEITPDMVSQSVYNSISDFRGYKTLTNNDMSSFLKYFKSLPTMIKNNNDIADFVFIKIYVVNYHPFLIFKRKDDNYYIMYSLTVDEEGHINDTNFVNEKDIPYVILNFFKSTGYKQFAFLIENNLFLEFDECDDKYIASIMFINKKNNKLEGALLFEILETAESYEIIDAEEIKILEKNSISKYLQITANKLVERLGFKTGNIKIND